MAENTNKIVQEEIREPTSVGWQQGKALGACLVEMFERCLWVDIKFRCNDNEGGLIKAHKNVLAARSPVFEAMFFGPWADGKSEVNVNADSETFRLFLRYLYCDTVTLTGETALPILEIAHCYQVSGLVQYCSDYLATVIKSSNVCNILTNARLHELANLEQICCSFIDSNAKEVLKSDGFMDLSSECLLCILKSDTFHADEAVILDTAEKWSRRKVIEGGLEQTGQNIRTCLGKSFYYLRLPTMTNKCLRECTSRKEYFSVDEYADIAAFINEDPEISVTTNSCVARVPKEESIKINENFGNLFSQKCIRSVFEISVTKDVALSGIVFYAMKPYLEYEKEMYTKGNCNSCRTKISSASSLLQYDKKVLKMSCLNGTFAYIDVLESQNGQYLPDNVDVVMSGNMVVNGFKYIFNLKPRSENEKISFNPSIKLKKRDKPYRVEITVKSDCGNKIQILTRHCDGSKRKSLSGHIQIRDVSGSFAGIKSIEFFNFSNRHN